MNRASGLLRASWTLQAVPILAATLVIALSDQVADGDADWATAIGRIARAVALSAPILLAHLAACRLRPWPAVVVWLSGLVLFPAALRIALPDLAFAVWQSAVLALFSLIFLLFHPGARETDRQGRLNTPVQRLPITLDGTVAALVALWVLGSTSLFASTPDAVRNQPLKVMVNWQRIASEPLEALWYLAQFSTLGLVLYGWYSICRYGLVRGVLNRRGIVPFAFATVAFVALGSPLAASVGLQLPLNIPEWTIIPSEDHNPFAQTNYSVAIWLTVITLPIVLAVERLLDEQAEARNRHESVRAELQLLQQQVNPHFLFNTLNTLYALCLGDRAESAAAVVKLADLLRYVVYRGQAERVTLDAEMDYLNNYLDLQQLRFGHRCSLETRWPERESRLGLPPLLLIMLVENAFKHGVEPSAGPCEVRIRSTVDGRRFRFECINSLPADPPEPASGVGLVNLRRRLLLLFGQRFELSAERSDGMWRARLELDLEPC